jgi:hypothetical protein
MWQIIYFDEEKQQEVTVWLKDEEDAYRVADMYGDNMREMKFIDKLKDYHLPDLDLS